MSYVHIMRVTHVLQCSPSTSSHQPQTTHVFADSRIALLCHALRICIAQRVFGNEALLLAGDVVFRLVVDREQTAYLGIVMGVHSRFQYMSVSRTGFRRTLTYEPEVSAC